MITHLFLVFLFSFWVWAPLTLGAEPVQSRALPSSDYQQTQTTQSAATQPDVFSRVQQNLRNRVKRARGLLSDVGLSAPPLVDSLKNHNKQVQSQFQQSPFGIAEASPAPASPIPTSFPPSSGARDPFSATPLMQQEAQRQGVGPVFIPSPGGPQSIPNLRLRGYVTGNGNQPVALLEVAGQQVFLVREGDTISLQGGAQNSVLKVKKITKLSALVEVGTLGQVIVVR